MSSSTKRPDKTKPTPLYLDHTYEFWAEIDITFRGVPDASVWTEIDVMGCNGTRWVEDEYGKSMKDDDGFPMTEKVYGTFKIIWNDEEVSAPLDFYGMSGTIFG